MSSPVLAVNDDVGLEMQEVVQAFVRSGLRMERFFKVRSWGMGDRFEYANRGNVHRSSGAWENGE